MKQNPSLRTKYLLQSIFSQLNYRMQTLHHTNIFFSTLLSKIQLSTQSGLHNISQPYRPFRLTILDRRDSIKCSISSFVVPLAEKEKQLDNKAVMNTMSGGEMFGQL